MLTWTPVDEAELEELLGGAAQGPRPRGERSSCGRLLLVLYEPGHPLLSDRWEVWCRDDAGAWRPWSSWRAHRAAREVAERLSVGSYETRTG